MILDFRIIQSMATPGDVKLPVTPGHPGTPPDQFLHCSDEWKDFRDLNNYDLQILATLALNALHDRGILFPKTMHLTPKTPDIFDNAKFEQIACAGLQPKCNGSLDELIPTINAIHIWHQNKVWYSATFMVQQGISFDLIGFFPRSLKKQYKLEQRNYVMIQTC
jgi:hypothetical protein